MRLNLEVSSEFRRTKDVEDFVHYRVQLMSAIAGKGFLFSSQIIPNVDI